MTIREVASLAGVSNATVSRVINRSSTVSPNVVLLVREAMEKVGYRPLEAGRRRGRRPNQEVAVRQVQGVEAFAIVVPEINTGFYPSLIKGFDQFASELHHTTVVCNSRNDVGEQANQLMRLIEQRVSGVAMVPVSRSVTPPYQVAQLQRAGIPVVLLHRPIEGVEAPSIELPAEEVGLLAGRAIARHGHQRVAFFATHRYRITQACEAGLRHALDAAGIPLPDEWVDYGQVDYWDEEKIHAHERYLEERLKTLLGSANRPTAIFASYEPAAELIYLIATGMGLKVPEDLLVVTFGGAVRSNQVQRRLAAITVDETATGNLAMRLLREMKGRQRQLYSTQKFQVPLAYYPGAAGEICAQDVVDDQMKRCSPQADSIIQ